MMNAGRAAAKCRMHIYVLFEFSFFSVPADSVFGKQHSLNPALLKQTPPSPCERGATLASRGEEKGRAGRDNRFKFFGQKRQRNGNTPEHTHQHAGPCVI